jgi:ribonuclease Z
MVQVLLNLRAVLISHIHADHHLGLVRILLYRKKLLALLGQQEPPLLVVGPTSLLYWLEEYRECEPLEYTFLDCAQLLELENASGAYFGQFGMRVQAVPVVHCPNAFGFVLEEKQAGKIVYSGDTRPCESLVEAGKGAGTSLFSSERMNRPRRGTGTVLIYILTRVVILIHEATFESEMTSGAIEKNHSTIQEAISVAQRMGARYLLMNHFSQRYPKMPVLNADTADHVGFAFDLMSVRFDHFRILPRATECLKAIFEDMKEDE